MSPNAKAIENQLTFDRPEVHERKVEEQHEGRQDGEDDPVLVAELDPEVAATGAMSGTEVLMLRVRRIQSRVRVHGSSQSDEHIFQGRRLPKCSSSSWSPSSGDGHLVTIDNFYRLSFWTSLTRAHICRHIPPVLPPLNDRRRRLSADVVVVVVVVDAVDVADVLLTRSQGIFLDFFSELELL